MIVPKYRECEIRTQKHPHYRLGSSTTSAYFATKLEDFMSSFSFGREVVATSCYLVCIKCGHESAANKMK